MGFYDRQAFLPGLTMLGKGQPQLSILKLRFSNLNFGGAPAPAPPISMLTQDVFFVFLWPFLASTLKLGLQGGDGLQDGLNLSLESRWRL